MAEKTRERIYKFDNIKLLAILLVVIGHFIEPYTDKSDFFQSGFIFIYSFHMPLFIFISGLFLKEFKREDKFPILKVAYYLVLGFLLKFLQFGVKTLFGDKTSLKLLGGQTVEWFLFVMAMYVVTAFLLKRVNKTVVLILSLTLGLAIGFFPVTDEFYLSRYLVFMPFFFAGYYLTPDKVREFTHKLNVKLTSLAFLIIYFVMCFRQREIIYPFRKLFTGRNPYELVKIAGCSFYHRLLCYGISAVLVIAVVSCIPNKKVPVLSHMGENTLGVYFWHKIAIFLMTDFGFFKLIEGLGDPMWKLLLLTSAIILTLILSLDFFSYPLKAILKLQKKIGTKANCIIAISLLSLAVIAEILLKYILKII